MQTFAETYKNTEEERYLSHLGKLAKNRMICIPFANINLVAQ